jgi:hypothetical protein
LRRYTCRIAWTCSAYRPDAPKTAMASAVAWLSPPPLSMNPRPASVRTMPGSAVSQPNRSPGPTVLENEPMRITSAPAATLHSEHGAGPS